MRHTIQRVHVLCYQRRSPRRLLALRLRHRGELARAIAIVVVLATTLFAVSMIEVRRTSHHHCAVSGSHRVTTRWFGSFTTQTIRKSKLEDWIVKHRGSCTNDWRSMTTRGYSIFGNQLSRSCNRAPPIYYMTSSDGAALLLATSTDAQIDRFVTLMAIGSHEEQRAVELEACERAFK